MAVTTAYVLASFLGYALNRSLNFRSRGAVGPQLAVYAAVVTVNFMAIILGVTTGLAALGLEYQLARLAASGVRERVHVCRDALAGLPRCSRPGGPARGPGRSGTRPH